MKKMKNCRRIFVVLIAIVILLNLSIVASAESSNITIKDDQYDNEYVGYKLLNATNAVDTEGNTTDKYGYSINEKYASILKNVTGKNSQSEIIAYIKDLDENGIRDFADKVYLAIRAAGANITADSSFYGNSATEVDQGYWLIADITQHGTFYDDDLYSLVMLDTVGKDSVEVQVKKDIPTVKKEVEEINDSVATDTELWGKSADYDIGDEINFRLTGTVDGNIGSYQKYYYEFHDTMSYLTYKNGSAKVFVDGVDHTSEFNINWDGGYNKQLNISIDDLLSIKGVNAESKIVVTYVATLDNNAIVSSYGNSNSVYLEYSNNPYDTSEGKPTTAKTPTVKVVVFTYDLTVRKLDGDAYTDTDTNTDDYYGYEERHYLEGAGFTLYKWYAEENKYKPVGDEITGVTEFYFSGIDAGIYKLVETTVPDGYNKAEDIEFVHVPEYNDYGNGYDSLTSIDIKNKEGESIKFNEETNPDGIFEVVMISSATGLQTFANIYNYSGLKLPSTGGIGTIIFYTLGSIIFIGALVLLIAKLRMKYQAQSEGPLQSKLCEAKRRGL